MKADAGWKPVRLVTIARAEAGGWRWLDDPRRGPHGKALCSPRGVIYEVRMFPLSARRYRHHLEEAA